MLSGAGGDELFAGYPWRYYRAVVNDDFEDYVDKYYGFWQRLIPNATSTGGLRAASGRECRDVSTRDIFRDVFRRHARELTPEDYINHSLYLEAKTFLHGLLRRRGQAEHGAQPGDPRAVPRQRPRRLRAAPSRSAEARATSARSCGSNENEPAPKTERYFERTRDGKLLLRQVMQRYVPASVTDAVKQGFSAPGRELVPRREHRLRPPDACTTTTRAMYEYLDRGPCRRARRRPSRGRANRRLLLWSLLTFEHWCRTFLDGVTARAHLVTQSTRSRESRIPGGMPLGKRSRYVRLASSVRSWS